MGRRRKDPRDQAAQGFPGKRKSKTQRDLEEMEKAAARDAKLFVDAGEGKDLQALPVFLSDKRLAAAQTIWTDYAPRLDRLHLLTTLDRHTFAMFCIYAAEFVLANKDILDKGYSIMVTTVAGSKTKKAKSAGSQMPRTNPSVDRRDHAASMMMDLAARFGFTPLDRAKLIGQGLRFDEETLFGKSRAPQPAAPAEKAPEAEPPADLIGSLSAMDSPTPERKH